MRVGFGGPLYYSYNMGVQGLRDREAWQFDTLHQGLELRV